TVGHAAGGLNTSANLGAVYGPGARLYRLIGHTYYVAENAVGVPALFRLRGDGAPEELVEGVEDIQVTFGVDTSAPEDGQVDLIDGEAYVTADVVESAAVPGGTNWEKWARVVSVRVSLLMRSIEDRIAPEP